MTDKDLKQHVQSALDWEPSLDAKDIGVSVDQGVVTLRGNVGSYVEKITADLELVTRGDIKDVEGKVQSVASVKAELARTILDRGRVWRRIRLRARRLDHVHPVLVQRRRLENDRHVRHG